MDQVSFLVSGVTFIVDPTLLISHSGYFRALLSGNFRESAQEVIEIKEISVEAFSDLLEVVKEVEAEECVLAVPRLYRFPMIFELADRFCMNRVLRYLRRSLKLLWFNVAEVTELMEVSKQLGLIDELLVRMTKDFLVLVYPDKSIKPFLKIPAKCFTINVLSALLRTHVFWDTALSRPSVLFFALVEAVVTFVLKHFFKQSPVPNTEPVSKLRSLVRKSKAHILSIDSVNLIVTKVGLKSSLEKAFWRELTDNSIRCRSRIAALFNHARCIMSSPCCPRPNYHATLDVANWSWENVTHREMVCAQLANNYHVPSTHFCDSSCLIRNLEKEIESKYDSFRQSSMCCFVMDEQDTWLAAVMPSECSKPVFHYEHATKQLRLLTVLKNFRVLHALERSDDGSLYIVAEPSKEYGLLCVFRFTEGESELSLLSNVDIRSLFTEQELFSSEERLLKREAKVFLSGQSLHIFLLVPSYDAKNAKKKQFHLFSGIIDTTKLGSHLELHRIIHYNFTRNRDSIWMENWCVFKSDNNVGLVLMNEGLFVMQYCIDSGIFQNLGFLPSLPLEYNIRNFSPIQ